MRLKSSGREVWHHICPAALFGSALCCLWLGIESCKPVARVRHESFEFTQLATHLVVGLLDLVDQAQAAAGSHGAAATTASSTAQGTA